MGIRSLFTAMKPHQAYDPAEKKPVIRASICTGEQAAGFQNLRTGKFEEIMLIRTSEDLERFKKQFSITEKIEKVY